MHCGPSLGTIKKGILRHLARDGRIFSPGCSSRSLVGSSGTPHLPTASHQSDTMGDGGRGKLKILCLHGYMQNGALFKNKIGSMRKAMKSRAEFLFIDGPFVVDAAMGGNGQGRSWWRWKDTDRPSSSTQYVGWDVSQDVITRAIQQHGPIDVLLGFSQGATAAALYALSENAVDTIIIISGFLPRDSVYAEKIHDAPKERKTSVRACFVSGENDELVLLEQSQLLWDCFPKERSTVIIHPGGHFVPTTTGSFKAQLAAFLDAGSS